MIIREIFFLKLYEFIKKLLLNANFLEPDRIFSLSVEQDLVGVQNSSGEQTMEVFICCSYDFIFLFKFYCKIIDLFIKKNNIKRSVILKKSNLCLIFYWLVKILICLAKPETGGFCHHHVATLFCRPRCRRGDSFLKIWPTSKSQSEIID